MLSEMKLPTIWCPNCQWLEPSRKRQCGHLSGALVMVKGYVCARFKDKAVD